LLSNAGFVQSLIGLASLGRALKAISLLSCHHLPQKIWATALGTRAMTCRDGCGLIAKEQLSVMTGRIDRCLALLERKNADDPILVPPAGGTISALVIVQDPPVAREEATSRGGFEITEWGDAVLPWRLEIRWVSTAT
jgi:hypothetical protein